MDVLGAAGIRLRAIEIDYIYREFLMNAENPTVSRCEDILKAHNEKNAVPWGAAMRVDRDTVKSIPVFFYSVIITSEFVFPGMNPYRSSDVPVKCMRLIPL